MPTTAEQPFRNPEEEIHWLEAELQKKKEAYSQKHESKEAGESAREVLREASELPESEFHPAYKVDDAKIETHIHAMVDEPHHKQMDELIVFARKNGILNAMRIARKLGAHLLDDFHDRIIADGLFPQK